MKLGLTRVVGMPVLALVMMALLPFAFAMAQDSTTEEPGLRKQHQRVTRSMCFSLPWMAGSL